MLKSRDLTPVQWSVFGKIDPEEEPARYCAFLSKLLEKALRLEDDPASRLRLCNEIIERLAGNPRTRFLENKRLIPTEKPILLEITPANCVEGTTVPYTFLGSAKLVSFQSERPIQMIWRLDHSMPVEIFEENRRGG